MIQPHELMLNNLVMYKGQQITITELREVVCEVKSRDVPFTLLRYKYLDPIPLTPAILERCGFKQTRNTPELYEAPDGFLDVINDYGSAWYNINDKVLEVGYYHNEIPCEHLHQLQNLVSVLGQNLEVK